MNTITPMKRRVTWIVRLFFFLFGLIKPLQSGLINLSFIHFARWVIIKHNQFPRLNSQQPEETLQYDYLFFFSNFNGTWNQYIDAFSAVLNRDLNAVWGLCEKFPGAVPVTAFKQSIALLQYQTDYYYTAYPYATTNDVKAAHRAEDAFDAFVAASKDLPPEEFACAYRKLLLKVQGDLGSTGAAPVGT
jgi:hypothetical protein